jgi:hypothetical protein
MPGFIQPLVLILERWFARPADLPPADPDSWTPARTPRRPFTLQGGVALAEPEDDVEEELPTVAVRR